MCYSALIKRELKYLEAKYGAIAVREQIEEYELRSQADPKQFPKIAARIFPGNYAPIIYKENGVRRVQYMRYSAYPPSQNASSGKLSTFNARRDNLTSPFWAQAFLKHHGFIILEGFYEWVEVKDLLKAGVVSPKQVQSQFESQMQERKAKILASGKKYKPTATEKKDYEERKIIIQFAPKDSRDLLVPVIFSQGLAPNGAIDLGFAIVTDDPPAEVSQAGHDRCPVVLDESSMTDWLDCKNKTAQHMDLILGKKNRIIFKHHLDIAA